MDDLRSIHALRLIALIVLVALLSACFSPPPSHAELESKFRAHREAYDALRQMIREDGFTTVGDYGDAFSSLGFRWVAAEAAGLNLSRSERYKKLMKEARCQRIDVLDGGAVAFSLDGWGIANRGWRVAAMWSAEVPENVISSLDDFKKSSSEWEVAHSELAKHWYLRIVW